MVSYCSLVNDRPLTEILLVNSSISSSKNVHHFVNSSEWVDGLDSWLTNHLDKTLSKPNYYFDQFIGIYLPSRKSIPLKNDLTEKIKPSICEISILDQSISLSNEQLSASEENFISKKCSNKLRFPLRQVESRGNHREKFQYLLREEIGSLLTRETSNLTSKRPVIKIPSVEIKHQNIPLIRTRTHLDSKMILERCSKVQQILISPSPNQFFETNFSPSLLRSPSRLGLTVTPLEFSSPKQSIFEVQENPNRPSTQPVYHCSDIDQQKRQRFEKGIISSSTNLSLPSKSSHHLRFSSKTDFQRAKHFQFFPHISGKRIQINLANQTNS